MFNRTIIAVAAAVAIGCVPLATTAFAKGHSGGGRAGGHAMVGHGGGGHGGGRYAGGRHFGRGYGGGYGYGGCPGYYGYNGYYNGYAGCNPGAAIVGGVVNGIFGGY